MNIGTDKGIVRAGTDASRPAQLTCTQVAFGRLDDRRVVVIGDESAFTVSGFYHTNIIMRTR